MLNLKYITDFPQYLAMYYNGSLIYGHECNAGDWDFMNKDTMDWAEGGIDKPTDDPDEPVDPDNPDDPTPEEPEHEYVYYYSLGELKERTDAPYTGGEAKAEYYIKAEIYDKGILTETKEQYDVIEASYTFDENLTTEKRTYKATVEYNGYTFNIYLFLELNFITPEDPTIIKEETVYLYKSSTVYSAPYTGGDSRAHVRFGCTVKYTYDNGDIITENKPDVYKDFYYTFLRNYDNRILEKTVELEYKGCIFKVTFKQRANTENPFDPNNINIDNFDAITYINTYGKDADEAIWISFGRYENTYMTGTPPFIEKMTVNGIDVTDDVLNLRGWTYATSPGQGICLLKTNPNIDKYFDKDGMMIALIKPSSECGTILMFRPSGKIIIIPRTYTKRLTISEDYVNDYVTDIYLHNNLKYLNTTRIDTDKTTIHYL